MCIECKYVYNNIAIPCVKLYQIIKWTFSIIFSLSFETGHLSDMKKGNHEKGKGTYKIEKERLLERGRGTCKIKGVVIRGEKGHSSEMKKHLSGGEGHLSK